VCATRAELWIEDAPPVPNADIAISPRVGLKQHARAVEIYTVAVLRVG